MEGNITEMEDSKSEIKSSQGLCILEYIGNALPTSVLPYRI